ncbi:MAG: DoxX family protein [Verrucomicrobiota bacterium]
MPSWKKLAFGGAAASSAFSELGLLVLRVFAGLGMAFAHGLGKVPPESGFVDVVENLGFPSPTFFAWAAGFAELLGGLFLAAGFLTRLSALTILTTMLVAAFGHLAGAGFAAQEMALLYAAAMLPFLFAGCGRVGVDQLFRQS